MSNVTINVDQPENLNQYSQIESLTNSILQDLVRIENGWSGPNSLAPSEEIVRDVEKLLNSVVLDSDEEIDVQVDEDGSVTIYLKKYDDRTLSLDISGDNKVQCTYVTSKFIDTASEIFEISDFELINNFINSMLNTHQ